MVVKARTIASPREGVDEAELSDYLHAVVLGSYARNHSLIRLGRDTSFWNPQNSPTIAGLAVFLHELLHFIHNYSTIAGLNDFIVQLRLLRLYINTVDSNGVSFGEQALSIEAQEESRNLLRWRQHIRGTVKSDAMYELRHAKPHPPFLRIQHTTSKLYIGSKTIDIHGVNAVFGANEPIVGLTEIEIQVGSDVLMEGCAIEAECALYKKAGASDQEVRNRVPAYPYLTARAIFEGIADFSPTSDFLCRVCILALQSTDPGDAFVQLAEACKRAGSNAEESKLIDSFWSTSKDYFRNGAKLILSDSLQPEVEAFKTRGSAGRGLQRMVDWANDLLNRRLVNEFFELEPLESTPDLMPLVVMLRSLPICPVIQETYSPEAQELLYFSEAEVPPELPVEIGAAQALFHLTDTHIATGRFSETHAVKSRVCPFFKACRAPLSSINPEICEHRPWKSFNPAATEGCWYGTGVAYSRGRKDL
jgi:hypothetical protein